MRYYDPEAGRFFSRDPLGMWGDPGQRGNAQNYCGNNPVNRVDPLGLAPNRFEATTKEQMRQAIKRFREAVDPEGKMSNQDLLDEIDDFMRGRGKYKDVNGRPDPRRGGSAFNLFGRRYLYDEHGRWIDMLHFFRVAQIGSFWWFGELAGNFAGWVNECGQALRFDPSGSPLAGNEDLYSNSLGADFGDEHMSEKKKFEDLVMDYLEGQGKLVDPPRDPSKYPKEKRTTSTQKSSSTPNSVSPGKSNATSRPPGSTSKKSSSSSSSGSSSNGSSSRSKSSGS